MTADGRSLGQDAPAVRVASPRQRGTVGLAFLDAEGRPRIAWRMLAYLAAWSLVIGVAGEVIAGRHPTPARQLLALVAVPLTVAVTYGFRRWVDRRDWRGIGLPSSSGGHLVASGAGFLLGVAAITVLFTVEWAAGWLQVTGSELTERGLVGVTVLLGGVSPFRWPPASPRSWPFAATCSAT